jgi:enediyne biosynthesis protein E4
MWRLLLIAFVLSACSGSDSHRAEKPLPTLFKRLQPSETGIVFENILKIQQDFDVFRYRNFYNGGGVGIGDINNDELPDLFLTSNMGENKLYLNKGNFRFQDITASAGFKRTKVWSTGVSMVDINADGLLDIYVCNSGDIKGENRENELFINNGNLTFTDRAPQYGLDDKGFSTHAAFFDYDKDGDLDCYVLNNSFRPISTLGYRNLRDKRDPTGGDKLFENVNGTFQDVSESAGIFGSVIGFGLGVTVGDVNQDRWPDIYVSNDFYERDYLYINNRNGTFSEQIEKYMGHISMFSMGADLADLNNDGYPEIFSTDMLPEDDNRLKTMAAFETYDVYQLRLKNGYYHQFMRNMLQHNNKDGTFSEIGELSGLSRTDWSWGALMADFDNDKHKEIFISNGIYKDVTNQDFVEFLGSSEQIRAAIDGKKIDFQQFVDKMPSVKLSNYMFTTTGNWRYSNVAEKWGLAEPSFSNGAAYGDMDNDGDLDLIVNNVNQEVFVYKNQSEEQLKNNFLKISFKGSGKNIFGLGATVRVYTNGEILSFDHMPIRGFQSSMDYNMTIGLGANSPPDSLEVTWPNERRQVLKDVPLNATLSLKETDATQLVERSTKKIRAMLDSVKFTEIIHTENDFNDFDRDRLLYSMLSTQGPALAKGDLNNDGLEDLYVGGSVGFAGKIYMQRQGNKFTELQTDVFDLHRDAEDVASVFFDADGDRDLDLYVVSGGNEYLTQSTNVLDRLYENTGMKNGNPIYKVTDGKIPKLYQSGSCVVPADFDKDGDLDLFVGTRVTPSYYGVPCDQYLLLNDGKGAFTDVTSQVAPQMKKLGMVTDATWFDYDGNGFLDLLIVGEWMPVTIFSNDGKQFTKSEDVKGLANTEGWWNRIKEADLDADGDIDFVLGNLGLNSKFQPSENSPISLYVNDFDENGSVEQIFTHQVKGIEYPSALRQDLVKQMSSLKKQFVYYKDYAGKSVGEIFSKSLLDKATKLNFSQPHSCILLNKGPAGFELKPLPKEAQVSPVFGIEVFDFNNDKIPDLLIGGNLYRVKPEVGRYDALHGLVLQGDGRGNFLPLSSVESGLKIEGEVRHVVSFQAKDKTYFAFVRNNNSIKFYTVNK